MNLTIFADRLDRRLQSIVRDRPMLKIREIHVSQISNKRDRISLTLAIKREQLLIVLIAFNLDGSEYVAGPLGMELKDVIIDGV